MSEKLTDQQAEPLRKKMAECLRTYASEIVPYQYGGESILGIDCSGLAKKALLSAGYHLWKSDMCAAEIREWFKGCEIDRKLSKPGDLYFYGKSGISHVCICYKIWDVSKNMKFLVGANSGTPNTKNIDVAWENDAHVKIVKETYWSENFVCVVNPFLKWQ